MLKEPYLLSDDGEHLDVVSLGQGLENFVACGSAGTDDSNCGGGGGHFL